MKKHILLPTDFSKNARNAIDYALHLFEKESCIFYLLNAFEVGASGLSSTMGKAKNTRLFQAVKKESERSIQTLLKNLASNNTNPLHTFKGLSISDSLLNAIGKTTIDKSISYVIMGTKGSSAVKEVFMGSNTVNVLKHINFCRLIAVPESYDLHMPYEIAFATDFEQVYTRTELEPLLDLAKLWDSELIILHVDTGAKLTLEQQDRKLLLMECLDGLVIQFVEAKGSSTISEAIQSYSSSKKDLGMMVLIKYEHSFFEKLIRESVIRRIAFRSKVPLLVLPRIAP